MGHTLTHLELRFPLEGGNWTSLLS